MLLSILSVTLLAAKPGTVAVGFEGGLVTGKVLAGPSVSLSYDMFRIDLGLPILVVTEASPKSDPESGFLGVLLELHAAVASKRLSGVQFAGGTGLDYLALWGINLDEAKAAWPVFAEVNYALSKRAFASAQARYYLLHSDGFEPGVDRAGDGSVPLLIMVKAGVTL